MRSTSKTLSKLGESLTAKASVTHPDGRVYVRPGKQHPKVFDNTGNFKQVQNQFRTRVVELNQTASGKVVGDPLLVEARLRSSKERLSNIFDDDIRPFLDSTTRSSPIYKDVPVDKRTPRVLLPADTYTSFAPTTGVLHAYRMHHVRMLLALKKNRRDITRVKYDFMKFRPIETDMPILDNTDNDHIKEFVTYFAEMARIHVGPRFAPAIVDSMRQTIPLIVKSEVKKVVTIRKRRK